MSLIYSYNISIEGNQCYLKCVPLVAVLKVQKLTIIDSVAKTNHNYYLNKGNSDYPFLYIFCLYVLMLKQKKKWSPH